MEVQDVPGDLRRRARARDRHPARQHLGDAAASSRRSPPASTSRILAATKYVGGHADVMIGAVTATEALFRAAPDARAGISAMPSRPTTPGSRSRGLRTMAVRLKQHEESALKVAHWLKEQPEVGLVLHPALARLPRPRALEARLQGLVRPVLVRARGRDDAARAAFVDGLELFGIGYSWGGYESLALSGRPATDRFDAAGAEPGAAPYRPRGSRRPDRRPRGGAQGVEIGPAARSIVNCAALARIASTGTLFRAGASRIAVASEAGSDIGTSVPNAPSSSR